jgi:hypothetical protein
VEETIVQTKYQFNLVRIAVGKKVFPSKCELVYDVTTRIMELSYKRAKQKSSQIGLDTNPDRGTVRFSLSSESLAEFAYYSPREKSDVEDGSNQVGEAFLTGTRRSIQSHFREHQTRRIQQPVYFFQVIA